MLLTSAFSKVNSAISLEEYVLVFKEFATATGKLRVNWACEQMWTQRHSHVRVVLDRGSVRGVGRGREGGRRKRKRDGEGGI